MLSGIRKRDGLRLCIEREYLGWHSRNLRLVNCKISGTQPLCYAHDLIMENCTMTEDADLAFEYSSVQATIHSPVHSVKIHVQEVSLPKVSEL